MKVKQSRSVVLNVLEIPGHLPSLNDIIDARRTTRGRWNAYATLKKHWNTVVATRAHAGGFRVDVPAAFTYVFRELDQRRDPSNFIAGGIKLIEDGLQEGGLLENDGWKHVKDIRCYWVVEPKRHGVTLIISDVVLGIEEALRW